MAGYLTTVVGFLLFLCVSVAMFIQYLRIGLDSHSSVKIDPKPTNKL
ncbi:MULTISPECIES: hypothetical protein [Lysinibacillus]|nr:MULTISPECIES: hypothetical protein [Lysinibacillus]